MLGQSLHSGLASVVCWIPRRIRDPLFRSCDHDGRWCICFPGLESWNEGVESIDDAIEVGIEYLRKIIS